MPRFSSGVSLNTIERAGLEIRYLRISSGPQRDRYVHQLVMEAVLQRPLVEGEEVDHQDDDTLNNDWRNLVLTTTSDHARETRRRAFLKRHGGDARAEDVAS